MNFAGLQRESTRNSETREAERNALNLLLHKANSIRSSRAGPDWLWTDERISEMCNQSKLKSGFLEYIEKVAARVTEAERLLIVVCAQGADSDDVQKAGYGLKGDFLIGYDENGEPQLCSQPSLPKATADPKGEAVTLLTTSYFAGA